MSRAIHLHNVVAVQGRFPVLAGATLEVTTGSIVHLRGPNGAGKTSVLRVCAGLIPVVQGSAEVLGVDLVADRVAVRPKVGLLGHANGLYADLTVRENVMFWARAAGATEVETDRALAELALDGRLAGVPAGRLSTGQKRRTAIAAMLVRRPELWLLDEPHAGLDAESRDILDTMLRRAADAGATVVYASHELERSRALNPIVVDVVGGLTSTSPSAAERIGARGLSGGSGDCSSEASPSAAERSGARGLSGGLGDCPSEASPSAAERSGASEA
jgi:heme ABC exporter ATP-binding subunit CcmA